MCSSGCGEGVLDEASIGALCEGLVGARQGCNPAFVSHHETCTSYTGRLPCSAVAIVLFRSTADFVNKPFGVTTLPGELCSCTCGRGAMAHPRRRQPFLHHGLFLTPWSVPHTARFPHSHNTPAAAILLRFCILAVGSMAIGVAVALACAAVLKRFNQMEPAGVLAVHFSHGMAWHGMHCGDWHAAAVPS